jgi:hypothetical protein
VGRIEEYRQKLQTIEEWEPLLLIESGLPGPRGNLELLQAVVEEGSTAQFIELLEWTPDRAPTGTREEFLAACGAAGLGASIARGEDRLWPKLRELASDPRWRVREGVAMALQRIGDEDMRRLLRGIRSWITGGALERRAVAAGLCEPRLLKDVMSAQAVLGVLEEITASLEGEPIGPSDEGRVLRQALGYCWSVAIAALPAEGKKRFERWGESADPNIRWIVRENLKKKRLDRVDASWVKYMRDRVR